MSTTISLRIKKETKKKLEEAGVDITEEMKKFLEELAWKASIMNQVEKWDEILTKVKPSEKGFSVRSVREDRESH